MEVLTLLIIRAFNHLLQGESWAQARLVAHAGARIQIESGPFVLRLSIDERGLFHASEIPHQADVSITLPPDVPVRLMFERDTLFSAVKLGGSADIAESLAFVMRNLKWDAEADLAQLIGDIPARRVARMALAIAAAIQDSVIKTAENFSEYFTDESGLLATNRDVTDFGSTVNGLRDDVARLEKRLSRF